MKRLKLVAALGLGALLSAGVASAQQPGQPQPGQLPPGVQVVPGPGQPPGGQPGGGIQVRKIDPKDLPPSFRAPGGPMGPGGLPGQPGPGGRPLPGGRLPPGKGFPPGFNPQRPRPAPPPEEPESGHGHGEAHCPGHGPLDIPHAPNWWQGILMVNNELSQSQNPLLKLLFRYENHENPCDEKNQPPPFLASVLNFAVLAYLLTRFGKKPLAEALLKRKTEIMQDIETAQKLKEDAERRLEEYEEKLDTMDETLEQLRADFAAQSEQEKKHVLAEAEERRTRMRRDAEFRIEQELKSARAELLQEAVIAAVAAAEELLVKRVGPSDLDRMAEDYLKTVGASLKTDAQTPTLGGR